MISASLKMTNNGNMGDVEATCDILDECYGQSVQLSKDALRGLLRIVAECVFERFVKENASNETTVEESQAPEEAVMNSSTHIFIMLILALTEIRNDLEMDAMAAQYRSNLR